MESKEIGHIDFCSKAFSEKLAGLDVDSLQISGYPKIYLKYLIKHREYYIEIYKDIFKKIFKNTYLKAEEIVFIDYGTGNGLLAMFASLLNFNRIVAIDVDEDFIATAKQTADAIGFKQIIFINGSEDVLCQIDSNGINMVLAGTDVIEHIYNLDVFLTYLNKANKILLALFTTASNPLNPRIVRRLKKQQISDELYGGTSSDRSLFGNDHISFLSSRESIIRKNFPEIGTDEVKILAKVSRGLRKDDIIEMVHRFLSNNIYMSAIEHPTNTCDPETGSWSERLIELPEYKDLFNRYGFSLKIVNGFYDSFNGGRIVRFIISTLNKGIYCFPALGVFAAPYILLIAKKR